jgi:predicted nucleic acid-binding protein
VPEDHARGLLDTSVVIDLVVIDPQALPVESAISALTLAELSIGPLLIEDPIERSRRQDVLQRTESTVETIPFDRSAARAYGLVSAAVLAAGRYPRGRRAIDLLIAASAVAERLPLFTRNPEDFKGLEGLLEVVGV